MKRITRFSAVDKNNSDMQNLRERKNLHVSNKRDSKQTQSAQEPALSEKSATWHITQRLSSILSDTINQILPRLSTLFGIELCCQLFLG